MDLQFVYQWDAISHCHIIDLGLYKQVNFILAMDAKIFFGCILLKKQSTVLN